MDTHPNSLPLRVIFMGTPDFAVPALERLIHSPFCDVIAVYTKAPSPAGRGQMLRQTPVHEVALVHGIPVYTPRSFKKDTDAVQAFAALGSDVAVVAAYGLILPLTVLDAPRLGCLNIHASLLPRWRGAAPIQRAIEAGDAASGITIMRMEEGLDTGPMILKGTLPIGPDMNAQQLHDALSAMGGDLVMSVLRHLYEGHAPLGEAQDDSLSCYAPMLKKEEGLVRWDEDVVHIDRKVRAFTPWPGCWTFDPEGRRVKILAGYVVEGTETVAPHGTVLNAQGDIACGHGVYRITLLQPEGSKPMDVKAALNGNKIKVGSCLNAGN